MLCLSRNINDVVLFIDERTDEPIAAISIADIRNQKCRLGINAPDHIKILRKEIYDDINGNPPSSTMSVGELNSFFSRSKS